MAMVSAGSVCVYIGADLSRYAFGEGHPFGPDRQGVFWSKMQELGLDSKVCKQVPVQANVADLERFHTSKYVHRVQVQSETGTGYLDCGDTPAFPGVYEAAAFVVGSALDGVARILDGQCRYAFVPIAGLHHAQRDSAAGFCVFNDCGVVIETLRARYGLRRVAYVDIDAHHGDGVFYAFEDDPDLIFADLHEDGRYLYPGTGSISETGRGDAKGMKLNIPMPPKAGDKEFFQVWEQVEAFVRERQPEFILLQCGADSISGDPITHLEYSSQAHRFAAGRLRIVAEECCGGRLLAMGGGGYNRANLADAWTAVVDALLEEGA
ncbi:MAG: acetoin utilization protein AcuC [Gammaproteobacteria bacterium]